jgi:hypothetical protein
MNIGSIRNFGKAIATLLVVGMLISNAALAQLLSEVTDEFCVYGDCVNGRGTMELDTPYGNGEYIGNFREGEFDGNGRLEIPLSFVTKAVYSGSWNRGIRSGRGKYWNGNGSLYIGEWLDNKRHGRGSYFFHLAQWNENEHSEFWLVENTENYTGQFVNDLYQGEGTYRWANGAKFVGGFFANEKHGRGTYFYQTGSPRKQLWNYGDFVE